MWFACLFADYVCLLVAFEACLRIRRHERGQFANKLVSYNAGNRCVVKKFGEEQKFQIGRVHCSKSHQLEQYFAKSERFLRKTVLAVAFHGR